MVSNAFFKSINTTPLTRPLSIFTDQLLVASIVRLLKYYVTNENQIDKGSKDDSC